MSFQTFDLATDDNETAFEAAQLAVKSGKCIVMPTDTVYGIGCDAFNAQAVAGLLAAKHRGRDMPPPVLIAEPQMLGALVQDVPKSAQALANAYWPGALTLVLPMQGGLDLDLGDAIGTIAVRVPNDDTARELLRRTGPLAVSSANISGKTAATNIYDACHMLGDSVMVYLDASDRNTISPSTIVDFASSQSGRVIRLGALSLDQIRQYAPKVVDGCHD